MFTSSSGLIQSEHMTHKHWDDNANVHFCKIYLFILFPFYLSPMSQLAMGATGFSCPAGFQEARGWMDVGADGVTRERQRYLFLHY